MARRGSGGALFEPAEEKRDREVTLGPGMMAILAIGLLTLCGVCFLFGYGVGRRSPQTSLLQAISTPPPPVLGASNQPKPSASADGLQPPATAPLAENAAGAASSDPAAANPAAANPAVGSPAPGATSAPPPVGVPAVASSSTTPPAAVVQTALPSNTVSGQSIGANGIVHPALGTAPAGWLVQIAAVSQTEDANVLVVALRRRGYSVTVRRDPVDNLMHVQVGPFTLRTDAAAMRQRLLNDGYNAIIEP